MGDSSATMVRDSRAVCNSEAPAQPTHERGGHHVHELTRARSESVANYSALRRRVPTRGPVLRDVICRLGHQPPKIRCQTRTRADATEVRSDRLAKPGEAGATSNSDPRGDPYPRPRSQPAAPGFPWHALKCRDPDRKTRSCAGMRWSVPEVGTSPGTNSADGGFRSRQLAGNNGGQGRD